MARKSVFDVDLACLTTPKNLDSKRPTGRATAKFAHA
jgi:hypothetical protein